MWLPLEISHKMPSCFYNPIHVYACKIYQGLSHQSLINWLWLDWKLKSIIYDERNDFSFLIVNFSFLSSNIPSSLAYRVYMAQMIRYTRDYVDFKNRGILLTSKTAETGLKNDLNPHFASFMVTIMRWSTIHYDKSRPITWVFSTGIYDRFVISLSWLFLPSMTLGLHDRWC